MFKKLNYHFFSFIFHILEILSFLGENYKNVPSIHYSPCIYAKGYQSSRKLVRLYRTFGLVIPVFTRSWPVIDYRKYVAAAW